MTPNTIPMCMGRPLPCGGREECMAHGSSIQQAQVQYMPMVADPSCADWFYPIDQCHGLRQE